MTDLERFAVLVFAVFVGWPLLACGLAWLLGQAESLCRPPAGGTTRDARPEPAPGRASHTRQPIAEQRTR